MYKNIVPIDYLTRVVYKTVRPLHGTVVIRKRLLCVYFLNHFCCVVYTFPYYCNDINKSLKKNIINTKSVQNIIKFALSF